MARVLIVGCGCRGRGLARALRARGHTVRGTTRSARNCAAIEAAGAEPFVADPDRVGTLMPALDGVSVLCLLLGSAEGQPAALAALHGERLEMLLQRTIDTTVRGIAYEARGTLAAPLLAAAASRVASLCGRSRIPYVVLDGDPTAYERWCSATLGEIELLLAGGAVNEADASL